MDKHTASVFLTPTTRLPPFMAFPRFLLELNIGETPKLLYMVLLDRARTPLQNEGWVDEQGRVFLYYTIKNLAATFHRSDVTIKTALKVLADQNLIYRFRQGAGNPNRIYVKLPAVTESNLPHEGQENLPSNGKKTVYPEVRNLSYGEEENLPSDGKKTSNLMGRKLSTNRIELNNNIEKNRESNMLDPLGSCKNVLLSPQELTALKSDFTDWSMRIERLSTYMASSGKTYRNHAATIRHWAAQDKPTTAVNTTKRNYHCEENESL